jgi:hypothetical protein
MARKRSRSRAHYRQSSASSKAREAPQESATSQEPNFAEEYRYVVRDLKRFAVLAAAMFATLIVLALVLA